MPMRGDDVGGLCADNACVIVRSKHVLSNSKHNEVPKAPIDRKAYQTALGPSKSVA